MLRELSARRDWPRQYPPLLILAAAVVLAAFALPSALILPQASPTQTLEYAPVPGSAQAPPGGNESNLGLGTSATLGSVAIGGVGAEPAGQGGNPSTMQCVGSPPRETEDPLSPPCVPFFSGDNGGSTYPGVSRSEVKTVIYMDHDVSPTPTSRGSESGMAPGYYDLWGQPSGSENVLLRGLRLWQTYFNHRYQTYGRRVHFIVHVSGDPNSGSPQDRRVDAADEVEHFHQFASISSEDPDGNDAVYVQSVNERGVLDFGSLMSVAATYTGLKWSYPATVEQRAALYADYLCKKVAPYAVSFSGNLGEIGKPRRYGLLQANDPGYPQIYSLAADVTQAVKTCGITFDRTATFASVNGDAQAGPAAMAEFKQAGITTILRIDSSDPISTQAAAAIDYRPEWIVPGDDGPIEGNLTASAQSQAEWTNAWLITTHLLYGLDQVEAPCAEAIRSVAPNTPTQDIGWYCHWYDHLRQYFTAIQVAGPRLSPATLEEGMRAIPPHASSTPSVPACFYVSGDYSCVKDAIAEWWDPSGTVAGSQGAGCWRAAFAGRRFLAGTWPGGDINGDRKGSDPCNTYVTTYG